MSDPKAPHGAASEPPPLPAKSRQVVIKLPQVVISFSHSLLVLTLRSAIWVLCGLVALGYLAGTPGDFTAADIPFTESAMNRQALMEKGVAFMNTPYRAMRLICIFIIFLALDQLVVSFDNWWRDARAKPGPRF